jgi:hypothetical protein
MSEPQVPRRTEHLLQYLGNATLIPKRAQSCNSEQARPRICGATVEPDEISDSRIFRKNELVNHIDADELGDIVNVRNLPDMRKYHCGDYYLLWICLPIECIERLFHPRERH